MLHPASANSRTRTGQRVAFHGTAPVSSIVAGKTVPHPRIGLATANLRAVTLTMRVTRRMAPLTPRAVSARTAALDKCGHRFKVILGGCRCHDLGSHFEWGAINLRGSVTLRMTAGGDEGRREIGEVDDPIAPGAGRCEPSSGRDGEHVEGLEARVVGAEPEGRSQSR